METFPYLHAIDIQKQLSEKSSTDWFLFTSPRTITAGIRGKANDFIIEPKQLEKAGVHIVPVSRGGELTYHGPEQIIGFPTGTLQAHTGSTRGVKKFVQNVVFKLQNFLDDFLTEEAQQQNFHSKYNFKRQVDRTKSDNCAGVWLLEQNSSGVMESKKIVSIGMRFLRDRIEHGFCMNIYPIQDAYSWINPCGSSGKTMTWLLNKEKNYEEFAKISTKLYKALQS